MPELDLERLMQLARAIHSWLVAARVPHAFIGGFAVAFVGRPRYTIDIDAIMLVDLDHLEEVVGSAEPFGLRLLDGDGIEFARRHFVLRLAHEPSGRTADISIAFTQFEQKAIAFAIEIPTASGPLPILRPADLLVMKAFARRPQDLADIAGILDQHPDTNLKPVRKWLSELGAATDDDSVLAAFDQVVAQWKRQVEFREGRSP